MSGHTTEDTFFFIGWPLLGRSTMEKNYKKKKKEDMNN